MLRGLTDGSHPACTSLQASRPALRAGELASWQAGQLIGWRALQHIEAREALHWAPCTLLTQRGGGKEIASLQRQRSFAYHHTVYIRCIAKLIRQHQACSLFPACTALRFWARSSLIIDFAAVQQLKERRTGIEMTAGISMCPLFRECQTNSESLIHTTTCNTSRASSKHAVNNEPATYTISDIMCRI